MRLPGELPQCKRRRPIYSDPRTKPTRSIADLDKAILKLLKANGPMMKWELREQLHEQDNHLYRRLSDLRAAKKVKVIGRTLIKR